jgi:ABC-type multidrug transport system ATPase subunit
MILLTLDDLKVKYGNSVALDGLDASVKGSVIGLIGHNGAGKSTLIKALLGLLRVSSGSISIFEGDTATTTDLKLEPSRHMAFCPESGAVFSDITVESYIKLWCRLKRNDPSYFKKDGAYFLEALEIYPLLQKLGRELSKGQKRRVQTAIGFLINPVFFLIDEPFDGLDVQKTHELVNLISQRSSVTNFLVSSHRMDVIERIADNVLVLKTGKVVAFGDIESVAIDLADTTFILRGSFEDENEVYHSLVTQLGKFIVNKIGGSIAITGKGLTEEKLHEACPIIQEKKFELRKSLPSLVDAMTYHLKS